MGRRRRTRSDGPSGVLCIDKPEGPTSHDVVQTVKRRLNLSRVGHAGTLDPMATGVLLLLCGEATKFAQWLLLHDKKYAATIRLGMETDTHDRLGQAVSEIALPSGGISREVMTQVLHDFKNQVEQLPPQFSALKVDGKRAMDEARAGRTVVLEPRPIVCHDLELLTMNDKELSVRIHCGSGYYVRALARDLGRKLGVGAHLTALRRIQSGMAHIDSAVAPDEVDTQAFIPLKDVFTDVVFPSLSPDDLCAIRHGRRIKAKDSGARALLLDEAGMPAALAARDDDDCWRVVRGLNWKKEVRTDAQVCSQERDARAIID
jgi:tRNA pseudouridine55 synthase